VEEQLASIPKRVVTQSKQIPNQYSAERLNTMLVELQNTADPVAHQVPARGSAGQEVDEQIRMTREAAQQG
jgi:hypothetical protein